MTDHERMNYWWRRAKAAEAERDEWRQTAQEEHAAALDLIGVVKVRDQRIEDVRAILDKAHDEFEQPDEDAIRRALDGNA